MKSCRPLNRKIFLKSLGSRIARERVKKGLSQDQLADAGGFSRGTMSKIESGVVDPKATTLARIAKCLQLPYKRLVRS